MGLFDFPRRDKNSEDKKAEAEEQMGFDEFVATFKNHVQKTINWAKLFGSGKDTGAIDSDTYSTISSVYKPVKAIIDNAPQAKLEFIDRSGEVVKNDPLADRFDMPSRGVSYNDFVGRICGYYALEGEAFILIDSKTLGEQSGANLPSLIVIDPKTVKEKVDENTKQLLGWTIGKKDYAIEDVCAIKDFNPKNKNRGLSPRSSLKNEIAIDYFSLLYNKKFFENDASPGITLETDQSLGADQKKYLTESWNNRSQGVRNAFKARLLEGGLKVKQTVQSHKEMDFIEQKKLVRDEITGQWRVPKSLFNVTDSINYATFQGQMKMFWQYQISPMLRKVEDSLNMTYMAKYVKGTKLKFNFKNVPAFSEDMDNKVKTAETLFKMGFTRNEINDKLEMGFEEQPWGDQWWINATLSPAGEAPIDPEKPAEKSVDPIEKAFEGSEHMEAVIKGFLTKHERIEAKMAKKVKRHFYNLRKDILELPDNVLGVLDLGINWESADDSIKKLVAPLIREAVEAGINSAEDDIGKGKAPTIAKEIQDAETGISETDGVLNSYFALRLDKITGINRTIRKMLLAQIEKALKNGVISGGTMTEIARGVRDVTREFFNNAGSRSKLIARTETTGAMNGGAMAYYKDAGMTEKSWETAHDEHVRDSHIRCQSQSFIDIDKTFVNGLMHPGDQAAGDVGEVANCRCRLFAK